MHKREIVERCLTFLTFTCCCCCCCFFIYLFIIFFFYDGQDGHRVVCGSQIGTLLLYSWGCFKDCRYIILNAWQMDKYLNFLTEMRKLSVSHTLNNSIIKKRKKKIYIYSFFLTGWLWFSVIAFDSIEILLVHCWRWVGVATILASLSFQLIEGIALLKRFTLFIVLAGWRYNHHWIRWWTYQVRSCAV